MLTAVLQSQYTKALNILWDVLGKYQDDIWYDCNRYRSAAWQIAYHGLFYTNIYAAPSADRILKWPGEREDYNDFSKAAELRAAGTLSTYTQAQLLEYLAFVGVNVPVYLKGFRAEERCWPFWYDQNQLEFHITNLRHLQHHTAELIERHDERMALDYNWQ